MAMQDRAMANHDLGKDVMINHVLATVSMVANPFFFRKLPVFETIVSLLDPCSRSPLQTFYIQILFCRRYCTEPLATHLENSLRSMYAPIATL